jgi:hypothetical protein
MRMLWRELTCVVDAFWSFIFDVVKEGDRLLTLKVTAKDLADCPMKVQAISFTLMIAKLKKLWLLKAKEREKK